MYKGMILIAVISLLLGCDSKQNTTPKAPTQPKTTKKDTPKPTPEKTKPAKTEAPKTTGVVLSDFQKCLDLKKGGTFDGQVSYTVETATYFGKSDCLKALNTKTQGAFMFGDYFRKDLFKGGMIDKTSSTIIMFDEKTNAWTGTSALLTVAKGQTFDRFKKMAVVLTASLAKGCKNKGQFGITSGLAPKKAPTKTKEAFAFIDNINIGPGLASRCEMDTPKILVHASIDQRLNKTHFTVRASHGPLNGPMANATVYKLDKLPNLKRIDVSGWQLN